MERAKTFFLGCVGIFLVLAGLSLRSATSRAQTPPTLDVADWYQGYMGGVVNRVLVRYSGFPDGVGGATRITTPPIPGTSPVVGVRPDNLIVILANGEVWQYTDQWRLGGNMLEGVLSVQDGAGSRLFNLRVSPNPSMGSLTADFTLGRSAKVDVDLMDVQGRVVRSVTGMNFGVGQHAVSLGSGSGSERLEPGTYFVRLRSDGGTSLSKAVVVR